jgi:hypothetical protein
MADQSDTDTSDDDIDINPESRPNGRPHYEGRGPSPIHYAPLFEALFHKLHLKDISTTLPDPRHIDRTVDTSAWAHCMKQLHAKNIDVINYCQSEEDGVPRATSTLTLRFKTWEYTERFRAGLELTDQLRGLCEYTGAQHSKPFEAVDCVRFVGLLSRSCHPDKSPDFPVSLVIRGSKTI